MLSEEITAATPFRCFTPDCGYGRDPGLRAFCHDRRIGEFFPAHAPIGTPIPELISVAGMRWKIEENNETGKDLLGLTEYRVRRWDGWYRHVSTVMLALAFLAVTRANLDEEHGDDRGIAHPLREDPR